MPVIYTEKYDHEIVKYNPIYYNDGCYTSEEWTDIDDVGKVYDGKIFTISEYLEVEQRYINTIVDIMKFVGSKYLTVSYVELNRKSAEEQLLKSKFYDEDIPLLHYIKTFNQKKHITIKMIEPIGRLCMRGYLFVKLVERKHRLKFEFGYDLYLSATCGTINQEQLNQIVRKNDLYLDPR